MKTIIRYIKPIVILLPVLAFIFVPGCALSGYQSSNNASNTSTPPAYNIADLNNYGEWVQTDNYGEGWHPFVSSSWAPYDNGHWSYINGYWTWVSYEPFGWIVYHYGYWYYDSFYGWTWIPGNDTWSPANVIWNNYGDYISWAPLPPRGVSYGHPWERDEDRYWHVVRARDFTNDNVGLYNARDGFENSTAARNYMSREPSRERVEKSTGRPVTVITSHRSEVKTTKRKLERMNLPQPERRKVEQNSEQIKRKLLIQRDRIQRERNDNRDKRKVNRRR